MRYGIVLLVALVGYVCGVESAQRSIEAFVNASDVAVRLVPFNNDKRYSHRVAVMKNGTFHIPLLENKESYLLEVESASYQITPNRFRIDVGDPLNDLEEYKIWELKYGDEFSAISSRNQLKSVNITDVVPLKYVESRHKPFMESSVVVVLKENPLYLAMGVVFVSFSLLPQFLKYVDPESVAGK